MGRVIEEEPRGIDLTPMLDVVFIMLIFFVVTATFVKEAGIDINPPDPNTIDGKPNPDRVVVSISANNRISIGQEPVDPRLLRARLEQLRAQNPKTSLVLNSHSDSATQSTVTVMDTARLVGIQNVALAAASRG